MKFSEFPYKRVDKDALIAKINASVAALEAAKTFEEAEKVFLDLEAINAHAETMFTVANIRHDINTADEFYDGEVAYADEAQPEIGEYAQKWTMAMLASPFRPDFEKKYGALMFKNAEIELKSFSPEIIPELQRENALTTEYTKLIASAKIPFEGNEYTVSQMAPFKIDPDDARRLAAWKAEAGFYKQNQQRLDEIYDELVHLRDTMGRKLGYDGYTQLGYYRMMRNCYTKEDIEKFRAAVVKFLVPVASEIYKRQAKRLGKAYPMSFADNALEFRSGNPRPAGTPEDILAQGRTFYHELSPETAKFIDEMYDHEMLDVLSRPGKAGGGYCTSVEDMHLPFIFANFNGTSGDVEVVTHEAGHAFAAYTARDVVPASYRWPTMEACEVHSMSMEFFAWPWAEGFFGKDARKFRYTHLSAALTFIPYGTMVDHFQHIVYEKPDMTPAERHAVWKELLGVYMPWMKLDGDIPFYSEGQGWQRQLHIYTSPFYYIDYCLAQTMSLQFWARIIEDPKKAFETYMRYTRPAGSLTFLELVEQAGLVSPFGDQALADVCEKARVWLENYDLTGIE
ncbi:MAG: M3 family oligoendopeptidase [Oscillospiraceae bacterium]|nr:M3 family oligoendopeptidase [Oscillospiraceae bacterium]